MRASNEKRFHPAPLALAAALTAALAAGVAPLAHAQSAVQAAPAPINLPAMPLGQALNELARQANLQMTFPAALVAGKSAPGVSGTFTARQALDKLLAGSGLTATLQGTTVLVIPAQTPAPQERAQVAPIGDTPEVELAEVVVTGTKRSQVQQQVAQSLTVLTERDTVGMSAGPQVFARVTNVAQQSEGFLPTVRGLDGNGIATGGGGAVSGASPRLSNYIDGVARTYGATPDGQGSFWDMAQVEVYRGAQSTQLGQNSIAGAIVQTTNDPKFKDEASVQVGVRSEATTYDAAFMVNKVLSEQVAVRFTSEAIDGKNFIDYSGFQGAGLTPSDRDELGRIKYKRHRAKLLFAPTDAMLLKLTLEREDRQNPYTQDLASNSPRREVASDSYGHFESVNDVVALNANVELGNGWSLDAVLSQQKATSRFGPPVVGSPDPAAFLDFSFQSTETAFEPKLIYKAQTGRTGAVFGGFFKERDRTDTGKPGSLFILSADDQSSSRSIYSDATIELSPSWDLLAAGRYENDRQRRDFSAFNGLLTYDFNEKNAVFLPKLGATYHHSPDASLSLLAYKGYNASGGGVSFVSFTPYTFKKETSSTVELVSRTQWLDRKLTANANLFFTQLNDTQVSGIGPAGPDDGIYLNIAKARSKGLEFDLAYQPSRQTRLHAALGLLDTEIVNFGSAANNFRNGNQFGLAPRLTANVGGSVEVVQGLTLGGNVSFVGKRFTDYENRPEDRLDSYVITNLHAQYRVGKSATVTAYINNLFDKLVQFSRYTAFNQAYVNPPRTVGVKLKMDF